MLTDKLNLALIAAIVMAVCGMLVFSEASTVKAAADQTTIYIVGKAEDTAVGTITFPQGEPSATISDPYSNVDSGSPQVVAASNSEPVARLKNTSGGTLTVWLEITGWTNGIVTAEDYELVTTGTATVDVVDNVLSADGGAVASFSTGLTIDAGLYKDLYLEVTLGAVSGKSGSSTLTILGET